MNKGNGVDPATGTSSKNLKWYLGTKLKRQTAVSDGSVPNIPLPAAEDQKPLVMFTDDQVDSSGCLVDIWNRRLGYHGHTGSGSDPFATAAFAGHDAVYKDASAIHADICSYGQYESGQDDEGKDCKISTWRKQWK
jgi:hypothetical protein